MPSYIEAFFCLKKTTSHCSPGFKRYGKENSSPLLEARLRVGREQYGLLNLTLQELGTLKRDWQYQAEYISGITPSQQPLPRMRDIPLPPGSRDSLISLRTHAYEYVARMFTPQNCRSVVNSREMQSTNLFQFPQKTICKQ